MSDLTKVGFALSMSFCIFVITAILGINADLRRDLAALRAAQAAVVVQPPPTEDACVAWLFHADLKGAKARMCGRR